VFDKILRKTFFQGRTKHTSFCLNSTAH